MEWVGATRSDVLLIDLLKKNFVDPLDTEIHLVVQGDLKIIFRLKKYPLLDLTSPLKYSKSDVKLNIYNY
jgi:hypothetical protein